MYYFDENSYSKWHCIVHLYRCSVVVLLAALLATQLYLTLLGLHKFGKDIVISFYSITNVLHTIANQDRIQFNEAKILTEIVFMELQHQLNTLIQCSCNFTQ